MAPLLLILLIIWFLGIGGFFFVVGAALLPLFIFALIFGGILSVIGALFR